MKYTTLLYDLFINGWVSLSFLENFWIARIEELKLMYAMIKKRKVSPVKLMMNYWLSIPGLKGSVTCTLWVTHPANNLGLLENANVTYIDTPYRILGYTFFNKAHSLKKGKWKHRNDVQKLNQRV
jgi:hypothetical protein